MMQLLLRRDVRDLGNRGEVVEVADGYGRNYLLPRGMAVEVNPANVRQLEKERKELEVTEARRRASLEEFAGTLGKVSVTIQARANEEGHLFGSVGAVEIAAAVKEEEDIDIEPEKIVLEKPIKELGVFEVAVHLDPTVASTLKVWVVGE